jgi:hypothetical protein
VFGCKKSDKILQDEQYTGTYIAGKYRALDVGGKQIKQPKASGSGLRTGIRK